MAKVPVNMRLDADLLAKVDEHAGPGGRTRFFETAARLALGERAPSTHASPNMLRTERPSPRTSDVTPRFKP